MYEEWRGRPQEAVEYILQALRMAHELEIDRHKVVQQELEHLHIAMEIEDIARAAISSKYLQRLFHALTGFTVTGYVRNRRFTLSAEELISTNHKVIDIALKYGYESPEEGREAQSVSPPLLSHSD